MTVKQNDQELEDGKLPIKTWAILSMVSWTLLILVLLFNPLTTNIFIIILGFFLLFTALLFTYPFFSGIPDSIDWTIDEVEELPEYGWLK